jgi:Rrf2 family protein
MKISTKTRYGTRLLLDLALHGDEGAVPLSAVAKRQEISEKYLWQLASALKSAGMVATTVGSGGGYRLAVPPGKITLLDVFSAFDGPVKLVHCVRDGESCLRSTDCITREAWRGLNRALEAEMKKTTIADLLKKARSRSSKK